MLYKEYEYDLPPTKTTRRLQTFKQEPMASDDSRLSEDSNADVPLGSGMMLLLEACERLAEEDCTAETRPAAPRRATRRRTTIAYATGTSTTDAKSQPQQTATKRRSRTELHGPCCHCGATESPQWRKGPMCKPVLCNACGTRFLRTRSLGKVVIGRNGRRYAKEEPVAEEETCENSTGSTEDTHQAHTAPTRRDSRLGLSRPTKTRRLDPSTPLDAISPTSLAKPVGRQRTTATSKRLLTAPYLPPASSITSPPAPARAPIHNPPTPQPVPHPHPHATPALLFHRLLSSAARQHPGGPFALPPAPHTDVALHAPVSPRTAAGHYTPQHLHVLKPLPPLHCQPDLTPVFLHVQAGPLS